MGGETLLHGGETFRSKQHLAVGTTKNAVSTRIEHWFLMFVVVFVYRSIYFTLTRNLLANLYCRTTFRQCKLVRWGRTSKARVITVIAK